MSIEEQPTPPELVRHVSELVDGQLQEEDWLALCNLLRDDEAAQNAYRRMMSVHAMLHFDLGQGCQYLTPPIIQSQSLAPFAAESRSAPPANSGASTLAVAGPPGKQSCGSSRRTAVFLVALAACLLLIFSPQMRRLRARPDAAQSTAREFTEDSSPPKNVKGLSQRTGRPPLYLVIYRSDAKGSDLPGDLGTTKEGASDLSVPEMEGLLAHLAKRGAPRKSFTGNRPERITQRGGGAVRLPAAAAQVYGSTLVFEQQYGNLGYWGSRDDWAVWQFTTTHAGSYDVAMEYACEDPTADNRFVLNVDDAELSGKVKGTGTWDDYRDVIIGQVELGAGNHRLVFRSAGDPDEYLIDLRSILLRPRSDDQDGD